MCFSLEIILQIQEVVFFKFKMNDAMIEIDEYKTRSKTTEIFQPRNNLECYKQNKKTRNSLSIVLKRNSKLLLQTQEGGTELNSFRDWLSLRLSPMCFFMIYFALEEKDNVS